MSDLPESSAVPVPLITLLRQISGGGKSNSPPLPQPVQPMPSPAPAPLLSTQTAKKELRDRLGWLQHQPTSTEPDAHADAAAAAAVDRDTKSPPPAPAAPAAVDFPILIPRLIRRLSDDAFAACEMISDADWSDPEADEARGAALDGYSIRKHSSNHAAQRQRIQNVYTPHHTTPPLHSFPRSQTLPLN